MKVWVQLADDGKAIRIFKSATAAYNYLPPLGTIAPIGEMDRRKAVGEIRNWVYKNQDGKCFDCQEFITKKAHLHERIPRGKGGEISRENSYFLCAACHLIGKGSAHGERRTRFGE